VGKPGFRERAFKEILEKGPSRREVARLSDHSPNAISYWVRNYQLKGLEGLLNKS
jgi:transposase-like protein